MTTYLKPLTPALRQFINIALDKKERDLCTCEKNTLVMYQMALIKQDKKLIKLLPDGFPINLDRWIN